MMPRSGERGDCVTTRQSKLLLVTIACIVSLVVGVLATHWIVCRGTGCKPPPFWITGTGNGFVRPMLAFDSGGLKFNESGIKFLNVDEPLRLQTDSFSDSQGQLYSMAGSAFINSSTGLNSIWMFVDIFPDSLSSESNCNTLSAHMSPFLGLGYSGWEVDESVLKSFSHATNLTMRSIQANVNGYALKGYAYVVPGSDSTPSRIVLFVEGDEPAPLTRPLCVS